MAFTFKTNRATGQYASFYGDTHDIKIKRKVCGEIVDRDWRVRLMVKKEPTEQDPAPFFWITFKYKGSSLNDVKEFLNEHFDTICMKYDLFFDETPTK